MSDGEPGYSFGIRHLLWLTALYAASIATLGAPGALAATFVSFVWSYTAACGGSSRAALGMIAAPAGLLLILAWGSRFHFCSSGDGAAYVRLNQVSLALKQYHADHGRLPPTTFSGSDGESTHSWRVLLLPYLDRQDLYDRYRFDEPWDGPNNRLLLEECPFAFCSWTRLDGSTEVLALVEEGTPWAVRSAGQQANQALVIESTRPVPWLEPVDESFDPKRLAACLPIRCVSGSANGLELFFLRRVRGPNLGMSDGTVVTLRHRISHATWTQLVDTKQPPPVRDAFEGELGGEQTIYAPNVCRCGMLLIVIVIPGISRFRRQSRT